MNDALQAEHPELHIAPAKRRFGLWSKLGGGALAFALLVHGVILLAGAVWIFQITRIPEKKIDFLPGGGGGGDRSAQKVQQKKRAQITPSSNVKRVFAEGAKSQYSIPDPGDNFGTMSALSALTGGGGMTGGMEGAGKKGFGAEGMGNGSNVKLFALVPETMGKRCSKDDRLLRLKENGGTPACEDAVLKGLRWLQANQAADGSWPGRKPAMTGLALLAYFGHCETPASEEFGDTVQRGIVYLVNLGMQNDGRLASKFTDNSWPYEHAIATYALAEAYTFCKELKHEIPNLREVAEKGGQFIIDNQHDKGGWSYLYTKTGGHADVSVAGWQIQALKACSHTGINYRGMSTCITKALKYLSTCQNKNGGFGYTDANAGAKAGYFCLTGVGMLCNQMWGKGSMEVHKGAKYILENSKLEYNTTFCDLYGHYYESQAMMQRGGEDWKQYNGMFRDQILNNQDADGSWKTPGGGTKEVRANGPEYVGDKTYRTCLCTLMLEVYYRFLSTGGGTSKDHSGI